MMPAPRTLPPTVYAITHREYSGLSHREQVGRLLQAGARVIQLREKSAPTGDFEAEASACAEMCRRMGALLIVNDDAELAARCGADGVHVGQGDLSPTEARAVVGPGRIVGISTHNSQQLHAALNEPVDYIAVGPVFGTSTKANPDPATGMGLVREAAGLLPPGRSLVAIGGIDRTNIAALVREVPCVVPAVIGAVMKAPDIARAFAELEQLAATARGAVGSRRAR